MKGALAPANIEIQFVSDAMPKSPLGDLGVKTRRKLCELCVSVLRKDSAQRHGERRGTRRNIKFLNFESTPKSTFCRFFIF